VTGCRATIVEILPGKGKFSGMMGSLLVTDENGRIFYLGTGFSNNERINPPAAVGTNITYKYTRTTKKGLPKFDSFLRIYQQF
jgi:DNA ligase-1